MHVWITGMVQGVSFRYYTMLQAERWNLSGWVRNLYDGRVEAVFCGRADAVKDMLAWCGHGPPAADVVGIDVQQEKPGSHNGFHIRPTARGSLE